MPNHVSKESRKETAQREVKTNASENKNVTQFKDKRSESVAQMKFQEMADSYSGEQAHPIQKKENNTGLPDGLKSGVENLSGHSMDDVKVHYNSDKPAQLNAHAYAQGTNIHVASGQEKHLPHEAWHVVQQKQGRVKPTVQAKGVQINDDKGLEKEADTMGSKAVQSMKAPIQGKFNSQHKESSFQSSLIQAPVTQLFLKVFSKGRAQMLRFEAAGHILAAIASAVIAAAGIAGGVSFIPGVALIPGILALVAAVSQAIIGVSKLVRAHLMINGEKDDNGKPSPKIKKYLALLLGMEAVLWGLSIPAVASVGGVVAIIAASMSGVGALVKLLRAVFTTTASERFLGVLVIFETILGGFGNIAAIVTKGTFKLIAPIAGSIVSVFKSLRGMAMVRFGGKKKAEEARLIPADSEDSEVEH